MAPDTQAILNALADLNIQISKIQVQAPAPANSCDPCAIDQKLVAHSAARYNDQSSNTLLSQQMNFVNQQQLTWARISGISFAPREG